MKFYEKDSSIDILTQYTIFLITYCFFFWLRGFLNFAVSTTSSSHSFVFWNRYPFSLPVRFQLLNLAVFCWFLYRFAAIQPRLTNVCLSFWKKFIALASQSCCEVSRPRAVEEYEYRLFCPNFSVYWNISSAECKRIIMKKVSTTHVDMDAHGLHI